MLTLALVATILALTPVTTAGMDAVSTAALDRSADAEVMADVEATEELEDDLVKLEAHTLIGSAVGGDASSRRKIPAPSPAATRNTMIAQLAGTIDTDGTSLTIPQLQAMGNAEIAYKFDRIRSSNALAAEQLRSSHGDNPMSRSSTSGGKKSDKAIDCSAIGMHVKYCDPLIAKVLAHLQYPATAEKCKDVSAIPILTLPKCGVPYSAIWNNGFGTDTDMYIPAAMSAAVFNGKTAVFLAPPNEYRRKGLDGTWDTKTAWWQNDDGIPGRGSPCPGKTWYECFFEPHSACKVDTTCPILYDQVAQNADCYPKAKDFMSYVAKGSKLVSRLAADPKCHAVENKAGAAHRPIGSRPPTNEEFAKLKNHLYRMHGLFEELLIPSVPKEFEAGIDTHFDRATSAWQSLSKNSGPMSWKVHLIALFFRPNTMLRTYLDKVKKKMHYHHESGGRIAVHIRHSDYIVESPETATEAYCAATAKMILQTKIRGIYLATDDPAVTPAAFEKCVESEAAKRGWVLGGAIHVARQEWKRSSGTTEDQAKAAGKNPFILAGLVDTFLLAHCDAFVISAHSGFSYLSMLIAMTRGKAKHLHVVNCAHDSYASLQVSKLGALPNFRNLYDGSNVNECDRNLKTQLWQFHECAATIHEPEFIKHLPSPLEVRLPFSAGGGAGSCIRDILQYQDTQVECEMMCSQSWGRSCSMLLPNEYVLNNKPTWVSKTTGCSLIEKITVKQCVELSMAKCSPTAWKTHKASAGGSLRKGTFPCSVVGFDPNDVCAVGVYRDPAHHRWDPNAHA